MFNNQKIKVTHFVIASLTLLTMISCAKDQNSFVPYAPVDFYIPLATNNHLTIPGNSIMYRGQGYAGVIVTCFNSDQYYAFDACCPYEALKTCTVELTPLSGLSFPGMVYSTEVTVKCKCCGSEYNLLGGGYSTKGPSSRPLKQYQVVAITGRLWVHN